MKYIFSILLLLLASGQAAFPQGLRFHGSECPIHERTSFHALHKHQTRTTGPLQVSFDFRTYEGHSSGYILQMRGPQAPINLFYDGNSPSHDFKVILEGKRFLLDLQIPKSELDLMLDWTRISLTLNPSVDSISLKVGQFHAAAALQLPDVAAADIRFGRTDNLIDVPSFAIRNLDVNAARNYHFSLSEDSGVLASGGYPLLFGRVYNPYWLKADQYSWRKRIRIVSDSFLSAGYDASEGKIYAFTRDSLTTVSLADMKVEKNPFPAPCPVDIFLGSSFTDPRTGSIYSYEPYGRDNDRPSSVSVARLDPASLEWTPLSDSRLDMQMHHHNCWFDSTGTGRLVLFGGFGNRRYNGDFYSFHLDGSSWERLAQPSGDIIIPRYFSAMGYDPFEDRIYIYGGKGNEAGDQLVGSSYLYDLHSLDIESWKSEHLWTATWKGADCVASRSLVVTEKGYFCALCYPEDRTDSEINLYRFSLRDGSYKALANPIPIFSDRITTNANLYYDSRRGCFVALVEESPDDISSTVTVYTLSAPGERTAISTVLKRRIRIAGLLATVLLVSSVLIAAAIRSRRKKKSALRMAKQYVKARPDTPNSIMLFGPFTALGQNGSNLSARFTDRLRILFFVILEGGSEGVSSKTISALLWPHKDEDEAKNIRGVTLSKLRKLLSEFDGVSIKYSDGKFSLLTAPGFYCDYLEFNRLIAEQKPDMDALLSIISRGKFLYGETDPIMDKFRADMEAKVDSLIRSEVERRYRMRQYSNTITCADILLEMDPLNEDAISYVMKSLVALGRVKDSHLRFQAFIQLYKQDYGENYSGTYESLLEADL